MTKKLSYIAIGIAVISLAIAFFAFYNNRQINNASNTVLQKVLASGTLRVGYIVYPPYIIKDPKTGEFSGIFYDLTTELGRQLGLKIQWTEEPGYGTIFTSLADGRYDVYAGGIWANSTRAKVGYLTVPAFYNGIYAYAKVDDHRFDDNLDVINDPNIKISTVDGTLEDVIASTDYPKAQKITLPQSASYVQELLQVTSGKADVIFTQPDVMSLFLKENPGTLRKISPKPLRIFGNSYAVKLGEIDLYQMLGVAIQEAVSSGAVDRILNEYQSSSNAYLRVAPPYTSE